MTTVLQAALDLHAAGVCVIRASADGTKSPLGAWKQHMTQRPDEEQLHTWFSGGHAGIGIVCGAVSGNLDMLEFEGRAVTEGYLKEAQNIIEAAGLAETWHKLTGGYLELSPSGGIHLPYRIDGRPVTGNRKLAERPAFDDEVTEQERATIAERATQGREWWPRRTLMETRGEGGFTVVAPSAGPVHPSGKPWLLVSGSAATIPVLTAGEHEELQRLIRTLDQMPAPAGSLFAQPARQQRQRADGELLPGEDWAARTDWADILAPRGWTLTATLRDGTRNWRRPGKAIGMSATTGRPPYDNLYVFSTSTEFESLTPISKFEAKTILDHGGDHSAAARALRGAGYGTPLPTAAVTPASFQQPAGSQPAAPQDGEQHPLAARLLTGDIILDEPALPPAVWGQGEEVAWSEGEALILAGPDGVGKTTVAGAIVKARLGIGPATVLGMPVVPGQRNLLYLMMDRPRQIRRALRRIFTESDRVVLKEKLILWQGPPPADLARDTGMLLQLCQLADADTVIVDSLKDAALKLSEDETGSGWNRARQNVTAAGIQIMELHHPRKEQAGNKKPAELADLFGSRWISAGAGSVIMLWGKAGSPLIDLIHLKQPASEIGPFQIRADRQAGTVERTTRPNLVREITERGGDGITAKAAAQLLNETDEPTAAEEQAARRQLDKLTADGVLDKHDGRPVTWTAASHARGPETPPRGKSVGSCNAPTPSHKINNTDRLNGGSSQASGAQDVPTESPTPSHAHSAAHPSHEAGGYGVSPAWRGTSGDCETPGQPVLPIHACVRCFQPVTGPGEVCVTCQRAAS